MVTRPENIGTVCVFCNVSTLPLENHPFRRQCPSCHGYSEKGIRLSDEQAQRINHSLVMPGVQVCFKHQDSVHTASAWAVGIVRGLDQKRGMVSLLDPLLLDENLQQVAKLPGERNFFEKWRISICQLREANAMA